MMQVFNQTRISQFGRGGAILRSKSGALTDAQIRQVAPSVFAEQAHGSRSDKFTYIPTSEVLKGLAKEGFLPYEVRQGGSGDVQKRNFTKHMLRLRREGAVEVGDSLSELVLVNAHDGTSSYQLMHGLFRMVCSNGLVVADGMATGVRIPHKGDIVSQVIDAAYSVVDDSARVLESVNTMRAIELQPQEQELFAEAAAQLRFDDEKAPVDARQVNRARRMADQGNDLWRTFNRVQENLIQGGLRYVQTNPETRRQALRSTRPVNSIDKNVQLNRALWALASKMQELKTPQAA